MRMDYQQIEILEDKINLAVELIARLKNENRELKQRNAEIAQQLEASELAFKQMKVDFDNLQTRQEDYFQIKQREEKVREKVDGMLQKLNAIQLSL